MKQIIINVPDNKYKFFMELLHNFSFIKLKTKEVSDTTQDKEEFLNGQLALTQSLYAFEGINITNTDVHSLKSGTYIVKVTTEQGVSVKKMMVER